MADVIDQFPRLPYELMEAALKAGVGVGTPDFDAACREAWDRLQASRPAAEPIAFEDFRRLFDATLRRCPDLRSRPAA